MFTPIETTAGAVILHLATTSLLFDAGAVLGVSDFLRRLMKDPQHEFSQSPVIWFIAGMMAAVGTVAFGLPEALPQTPRFELEAYNIFKTVLAGLLTGWGTKHCGGCTSGHMLCGIGRLSPRSILATAIFFPTAVVTYHLTNSSLENAQCEAGTACYEPQIPDSTSITKIVGVVLLVIAVIKPGRTVPARNKSLDPVYTVAGVAFGLGLLVSGMSDPAKVQAFFAFSLYPFNIERWDPSLALMLVFSIVPTIIGVQWRGLERPPRVATKFSLPTKTLQDVNATFVLGAIAFGVSWGWTGICPGPAVIRTFLEPLWGFIWMSGFYIGSLDVLGES